MKLFLEGAKGIGKTTMILDAVKRYDCKVCGFLSVRMIDEIGETIGFCLVKAAEAKGNTIFYLDKAIDPKRIFLKGSKEKRTVNINSFNNIEEFFVGHEDADIIVLDELGGIELMATGFCEGVKKILQSSSKCIGTVKNAENYAHMKNHIDQTISFNMATEFREELTRNDDVRIMSVTVENIKEVQLAIDEFVKAAKLGEVYG